MGLWDSLKTLLAIEPMQERDIDSFVDHPGLEAQLMAIQGLTPRPWRVAGLTEALGVPAIFRAVSLIANTTGSLAVEAYRKGTPLAAEQRPRIIVRPNPFTTPRDFYRDTAYSMATRGEAWWWIASRDIDGSALSLLPVNPAEITVSENERDLRYPIIEWRGRRMPNADMVQITLLREPGALRGMGPLQVCGAAISVAVESQEWAANFFASGGFPSILIKTAMALNDDEVAALKAQWIATPSNMPKVVDPGIEDVSEMGKDVEGGQMMQAREYQVGDAARMFGIPGSLLDHQSPGSSLTYQNLEGEFTKFVRGCLWPNYLEPIEQAMTDLLTRNTTMKFDIDALQRADVKTRYEVYASGITSGVLSPEEARVAEGLDAGNMENAPVPFAPPQALPSSLPIQRSLQVRCEGMTLKRRSGVSHVERCNRLLAESGPFVGTCPRCKKVYEAPPAPTSEELILTRQMVAAVVAMASREPAPAPPPAQPAPPAQVTIAEGAIQVHNAPPAVTVPIAEGAIQLTTGPTNMTMERGAVEVNMAPDEIKVVNADKVTLDSAAIADSVAETMSSEMARLREDIAEQFDRPVERVVERNEDGRPMRVVERKLPHLKVVS